MKNCISDLSALYLDWIFEPKVEVEQVFSGCVPRGDFEQDFAQLLFAQVHQHVGEWCQLLDETVWTAFDSPLHQFGGVKAEKGRRGQVVVLQGRRFRTLT